MTEGLKKFLTSLLLLIVVVLSVDAADCGLELVVRELTGGAASVGNQYFVLIAIDRYRDWNPLQNPVKDAREIKEILQRRYYAPAEDFLDLYDEKATKEGIFRLFTSLVESTKPEDSVAIFYSGHGHLDKTSDTGFWIPADGGRDQTAQENWITNSQIRGYLRKIKARHVVLIVDSCFSGDMLDLTRGPAPTTTDDYFSKAY